MPSGAGGYDMASDLCPDTCSMPTALRSGSLRGPPPQEFLPSATGQAPTQAAPFLRLPLKGAPPPAPSHMDLHALGTWNTASWTSWSSPDHRCATSCGHRASSTCICLISTTPGELGLGLDYYVWLNSASGAFPEGTMLDFLGTWTEDIFCPEEALVKI